MNCAARSIGSRRFLVAAMVAGLALPAAGRGQTLSPNAAITGAWSLNKDQSDLPQPPGRQQDQGDSGRRRGGMGGGGGRGGGMGRRGGGGYGGGGGGGATMNPEDMQRMRDAMRTLTDPPDRMTIVQTDSMVVITTGDGHVTRLSPDGKKIKDENTRIERKTKWDAGKLVSEVSGLPTGKITETYAPDPERHQLVVTVAIEAQRAQNSITQRRVYDAADTR